MSVRVRYHTVKFSFYVLNMASEALEKEPVYSFKFFLQNDVFLALNEPSINPVNIDIPVVITS